MVRIIIFIVIFIIIATTITSWLLIKYLMVPNAKSLTEEELKICESIVRNSRGYPFVCQWALKHKQCPCLPCKKLDEAKA